MNYEQKYNKLVNAVKILKETNPSDEGIQNWVNENVPELAESEDEIPQKLHNLLCAEVTYEQFEKHNLTVDSALDWLEKQGEEKLPIEKLPEEMKTIGESLGFTTQEECDEYNQMVSDLIMSDDDMIEPKFHVGDWIISNKAHEDYRVCKITDIKNGYYAIESIYGYKGYNHFNVFEESYKLWNVNDAKPGDVLVDEDINVIGIFEGIEGMCWHSKFYYSNFTKEFYGIECGGSHQKEFAKPATKEQRDLLFSKMKEAGYEWDDEKKEPKLLITNGGDFESENCEQNPAWSAEDDRTLDYLLAVLEDGIPTDSGKMEKIVDWLRKLKQRIGG